MNEKSRTENSIRNIITGLFGQALQVFLSFINRMVFIRCLSADYLGLNGLFTNILSVLSLAELGIGSAIVFALYKPLAEKNEEKIAAYMNFYAKAYKTIGFSVAAIGMVLVPFLKVIVNSPYQIYENIYVLYFISLFNTSITYFFSYKSSLLIADQKNYVVLLCSYCTSFAQTIAQILILMLTRNYIFYLLTQTVCGMIFNVWISKVADKSYPCLKKKKCKITKEERNSLIKNIRALVITKLSGVLVNNTDNILITFFKGLATTGVTSNYVLLISTLNNLLNQIFNGLTASVGNLNAVESDEKKFFMFKVFNMTNFWLFGWSTIGFIFLSSIIVETFFGSQYVLDMRIVIIMAINFYTVGMQNAVWTYRGTLGLFRYGRYLLLVTATLNLFFSVVLGQQFGVFGILLATFISRIFTNIWYDPFAVFKYGLHLKPVIYLHIYLKYVIVLLLTVGVILVCGKLLTGTIWMIIFCVLIPHGVFYFAFKNTEEFIYVKDMGKSLLGKIITKR